MQACFRGFVARRLVKARRRLLDHLASANKTIADAASAIAAARAVEVGVPRPRESAANGVALASWQRRHSNTKNQSGEELLLAQRWVSPEKVEPLALCSVPAAAITPGKSGAASAAEAYRRRLGAIVRADATAAANASTALTGRRLLRLRAAVAFASAQRAEIRRSAMSADWTTSGVSFVGLVRFNTRCFSRTASDPLPALSLPNQRSNSSQSGEPSISRSRPAQHSKDDVEAVRGSTKWLRALARADSGAGEGEDFLVAEQVTNGIDVSGIQTVRRDSQIALF